MSLIKEEEDHRLSRNILPINYKILLCPNKMVLEGVSEIEINIFKETNSIILYSDQIVYEEIYLKKVIFY
jgi:hypothetical protein